MFTKILCACDGSENSFKALEAAVRLAAQFDGHLHVVLVEEGLAVAGGTIETIKEEKHREDRLLNKHIKRINAIAGASNIKASAHVFSGHPVSRIVAFAKDNHFDLLVIGATEHSGIFTAVVGSRADRLVELAHCPVLVMR
jgi:nucleotide-binding universal stress UspA family protein